MKLMGIAEIAEHLKVSRPRARQLADRDDFPGPVDRLKMGPVWRRSDVEKWIRKHRSSAVTLVALVASALLALAATATARADVAATSVEEVASHELAAVRSGFEGTTGTANGVQYTFAPTFSSASCGPGRPWRRTRVCILSVRALGTPAGGAGAPLTFSVWQRLAIDRTLDIVRRTSRLCSSLAPCQTVRFP